MNIKQIHIGLAVFILLFYIGLHPFEEGDPAFQELLEETPSVTEDKQKEEPITLQITAVGDIMVHGPQLKAQWNEQAKTHDFHNNFQFVKAYIQQADLALCNLETTFGGKERGYSSFPLFNSPDTLADALREAGFHGASTANNHTLDTGLAGVLRTLDVLEEKEIAAFGTRRNTSESSFQILEHKGIKIGLTAYTYETPPWGEFKTLNAIKIPKGAEALIDSFGYQALTKELEKLKERIQQMKAEGAELVIFYLHWGNEYEQEPNPVQRQIAQYLAEEGADIIFGSHPHVLQPMELIQTAEKETLVVYSMGNFLSNQRYEILKNRHTEDGIIVNVLLRKDRQNAPLKIEGVTYIPTWIHRYRKGQKLVFEILPLPAALEKPDAYNLTTAKDSLWRAENSLKNTLGTMVKYTNHRISLYTGEEKKTSYRRPMVED